MSGYWKKSAEQKAPPEEMAQHPNKDTIAAMREAERLAKDSFVKGYTDLDKLFAALKEGSK